MKAQIIYLTSELHDPKRIEEQSARFLSMIQQYTDVILTNEQAHLQLFYVRTGGAENIYLQQYAKANEGKKVYLLTSGENNSLAASMEILSYINLSGGKGEILHGTAEYIGRRITEIAVVEQAFQRLDGQKIGIIGNPSDWLIASVFDPKAIKRKIGVDTEYIPMDELLKIYSSLSAPSAATVARLKPCESPYFNDALRLYDALKLLIARHRLTAITLRCFDLLTAIRNTGCLSLALLNAEGICASCEGDVPTLLTMMIARALTGQSGFQANPSRINPETGELLFAHCTVPIDMVRQYQYDTHFESGIGVALHGELQEGDTTLMKVSGDLTRCFAQDLQLVRNQYEQNLCRTQVVLLAPLSTPAYFFSQPIANHHLIVNGHWQKLVESFMSAIAQ